MATPARLSGFTFIALCGEPPPNLGLEPLPPARSTYQALLDAVSPFLESADAAAFIEDLAANRILTPPGLHLVYLMGHAWLGDGGLTVAVVENGRSRELTSRDLLAQLGEILRPEQTLLVVDACHAAALEPEVGALGGPPRLLVTASSVNESAIALPFDKGTRLALALARGFAIAGSQADFVGIVTEAANRLAKDSVIPGQQVDYSLYGSRVLLQRRAPSAQVRREKTVRRLRNLLLAAGALLCAGVIAAGWIYYDRLQLELDLGDLGKIADEITIETREEIPSSNASRLIRRQQATGRHLRLWMPATNLLVRVRARFQDGHVRSLAHHLRLVPSWNLFVKRVRISLPTAREIRSHPGMAWIPATDWLHDRNLEPETSTHSFWIDLQPVTVAEYLPIVRSWRDEGRIATDESVLLVSIQSNQALQTLGLEQLGELGRGIADVFQIVDQANADRPTGGGELAVGLVQMPCADCPAPLTRREAELYCAAKGKRLPTNLEWELAARGVDGRVYPWGDRFDSDRANVVGLPAKGAAPGALRPVRRYAPHPSPFGLIDLIGNAGDWVVNVTGSYERVYMGGTYRFNPEDATTFLMMPVTEEELTVKEITVRCAADP